MFRGLILQGYFQENFTGISDKYEKPTKAEIVIKTEKMSVDESVEKIIKHLKKDGII